MSVSHWRGVEESMCCWVIFKIIRFSATFTHCRDNHLWHRAVRIAFPVAFWCNMAFFQPFLVVLGVKNLHAEGCSRYVLLFSADHLFHGLTRIEKKDDTEKSNRKCHTMNKGAALWDCKLLHCQQTKLDRGERSDQCDCARWRVHGSQSGYILEIKKRGKRDE